MAGTNDHAEVKAVRGANIYNPLLEELAIGTSVNICGPESADCRLFLESSGAVILPNFGNELGPKGAIWPAR